MYSILLFSFLTLSNCELFLLKKAKFNHGITNFNTDDQSQLWFDDKRSHNDAEGYLILDEEQAHLEVNSIFYKLKCKMNYSSFPRKYRKENYVHLNGLWEDIYAHSWTWFKVEICESNFLFNLTEDIRIGKGANGKNKNFGLRFEFGIAESYGSIQADLISGENFTISGESDVTITTYKSIGKNDCYQNHLNCFRNKQIPEIIYQFNGVTFKTSLFRLLENYVLSINDLEILTEQAENDVGSINIRPIWSLFQENSLQDAGLTVTITNDGDVSFGVTFSTPFGPINIDKDKINMFKDIFKPSPCLEKKLICYKENIDCSEVCVWEANVPQKKIIDESRCRCYVLDPAFIQTVCYPHVCCYARFNNSCEYSCTKIGLPCK